MVVLEEELDLVHEVQYDCAQARGIESGQSRPCLDSQARSPWATESSRILQKEAFCENNETQKRDHQEILNMTIETGNVKKWHEAVPW